MVILFVAVAAVLVFAIAAAFVGSESFRLGHTPTTAIFDLEEAVEVVADRLPPEFAATLTFDEVGILLLMALEHFESKGLSVAPGTDPDLGDTPDVVIADDEAVAVVLGKADEINLPVTDESVLAVLDILLGHLADIGALGPRG